MRFSTLAAAALVSVASADFTSYCCGNSQPLSEGDIAWALDPKNGRSLELGIAGGAKYTYRTGMCTFGGDTPMACGKYTTTARTNERQPLGLPFLNTHNMDINPLKFDFLHA
ncbi:hypothetical protein CFRS1_v001356 [Colletotrichum fructicola]|nr:hypothetical protein CFRS1_v001356 [Colletotrichum fructicola]